MSPDTDRDELLLAIIVAGLRASETAEFTYERPGLIGKAAADLRAIKELVHRTTSEAA